jgi:predicted nucleic acid-binding protein
MSPDPGDDLVIDCVMNANAWLITSNIKDFQKAHKELGLQVLTPKEFVEILVN